MTKEELEVVAKALIAMESDSGRCWEIPCPCCGCSFDVVGFGQHVATPLRWCLQDRWATIDDMRSPGELLDEWLALGHQARAVESVDDLAVVYMQATLRSGPLVVLAVLADGEVVQLLAEQAAEMLLHV